MLDSPRNIQNGQMLEFDICIAGAGAAGISLALELEGSELRVCLLEAGGLEAPPIREDHPYNGESVGRQYSLLGTRLRYFGGTTNHWGGWCRPLDEVDFQPRFPGPLSGWPIQRGDLDPYYQRAAQICEITPAFEAGLARDKLFESYHPDLVTKSFQTSPPTRFGTRYRPDLERSKQTLCLLDSTVVEIEQNHEGVTGFRVRSERKEFFIRAARYVLAMGAIENARLMLHSDRYNKPGVGNHSDFVGRCFADHVGKAIGQILASSEAPYLYKGGSKWLPHLSFRGDVLIENKLPNFGILFIEEEARHLLNADYLADQRLYPGWKGSPRENFYHMILRLEPSPNPDSRLVLIDSTDRYGMRRVKLNWKINPADFEGLDRITHLAAKKIGSANLGRMRRVFYDSPAERRAYMTYQSHQLGTTRMSALPKYGVVNSDCRVHFVDNLYVAGSSPFPTFGFANPTLTIVALAVRLAEHLKSEPQP